MTKKEKASAPNDTVIYRPGEAFGKVLSGICGEWQLSRNEAGKRLAVLAAFHFTRGDYAAIAKLADATGGSQDFVQACQQLRVAVDSANRARKDLKTSALDAKEQATFIERTVQSIVEGEGKEAASSSQPTAKPVSTLGTSREHRRTIRT